MTVSTFAGSHWTLTFEERGEWVAMGVTTADDKWRGTDSNGHEHYYERGYPTLDLIVDAEHWCDGREGLYSHDPHMAVDESHYECKLCREVVEPGTLPPHHQVYMPGTKSYTLSGVRSDGLTVEVWLMPEEAQSIGEAPEDQREQVVQALLDGLPEDRITSMTFSR